MMIDEKTKEKLYSGKYAAIDYIGRRYEELYPGSVYDEKTGLLHYAKSQKLKNILSPDEPDEEKCVINMGLLLG